MASPFRWLALLACVVSPLVFGAAAPKSDLLPKDKRYTAIATGTRLARPAEMPAVAADLASPFSPPDFGLTDPEAAPAKTSGPATGASTASAATGPRMSSAREILESMTALIPAKGTIQKGDGEFLLTIEGGKSFKVGDTLNISVGDGPKYPLEITRITTTDFTLRYQGEVKTRAIVIKSSSK